MKLGIITRYTRDTINYGNILQTYALNSYLNTEYPAINTETIIMADDYNIGRVKTSYVIAFVRKVLSIFSKKKSAPVKSPNINRMKAFQKFADINIKMSDVINSETDLANRNYNVFVVGSDVVWAQIRNNINRVKFLCFKGSENAIKFSYAASFGRDYIPFENRNVIRKALSKFKGISVREASSIELLKSIGISSAIHVCDPTLLLSASKWKKLAEKPDIVKDHDITTYIFVMLLNAEDWQIDIIKEIKKKNNCGVILVTNGYLENNAACAEVADFVLDAGSPGEWLWLINSANMVITDSFHCMIFSTIFRRRFLVLERAYDTNINNRMIDFLRMIKCDEKFVSRESIVDTEVLSWNYQLIDEILAGHIRQSKDYLNRMLMEYNKG